MTLPNIEQIKKLRAGPPAEQFLHPHEVPDWSALHYPSLDEIKSYPGHPRPYSWPLFDPIHTFDREYRMLRPDVCISSTRNFRVRGGSRPWLPHVSPSTAPLGPRRVALDHLGSAVKHLPRYIPPDAPVISHWSNEYHPEPDAHGAVVHCHWCNRPFASLGLVMNAKARTFPTSPNDPDQRPRHGFCCKNCYDLWDAYTGIWHVRVALPIRYNRDRFAKREYKVRPIRGRTNHKFRLNAKYRIRWDFLHRYVSTQGTTMPMNDIVPSRGTRTPPVTKVQRNKVRQQIYRDTEDMVRMAKAVLAGDHEWNSSQVQVFKTLMGKVLPDAHVAEEHTEEAQTLDNLSTEEIERLIAETEGVSTPSAPSVIDNEPAPAIKIVPSSEEDDILSVV